MKIAMSRVLPSARILVLFLLTLLIASVGTTRAQSTSSIEPTYEPGQLLIQVSRSVDAKSIGDAFPGKNLKPVRLLSEDMNIWLYEFSDAGLNKAQEEMFLENVRDGHGVLLAQFNHHVSMRSTTPNDPRFNEQYNLNNTGQTGGTPDADIDAPEAWDITTGGTTSTGDQIVVAIVDGGCELTHSDISYWKNTGEIPSNGIDDDGNGYVDDYDGWNAYDNNGSVPTNSHGTHVAGIAAARGNNSLGVSGVNWNCKVMPVAGSSGTESIVVVAYSYVLRQRRIYNQTNGAGGAFVVSTNSSFGVDFGQPASFPLWCAMYDSLGAVGILSACATANQNINVDTQGDIPTACPSPYMIAVTNTTNTDARNSGAAYGATTIDLGAPGTSVLSTYTGNGYTTLTGTSMATPHVCGAVALLWSEACPTMMAAYKQDPGALALVMRGYLLNGVDPKASLAGITTSGGRLNVYNSLLLVQSYPCGVAISHTPLSDTKETVNPYSVVANIVSEAALKPDSILLRYTIGVTNYLDTLVTTGNPDEYVGYIPAQTPGTSISYKLEAHAIDGKADTTDVYTFRVIDYAVLLTPTSAASSGAVDDTVFYPFTVTNDGLFNDNFNLTLSGVNWPTALYDNAGTTPVSSTGTLTPNATFLFKVRVIVPASTYGQRDTSFVKATSQASPPVFKTSSVQTTSAGQPLSLPFVDNFPSTTIDIGKWLYNSNCTVDSLGINPPTPPYALRLNGDPSGADTLLSQAIDLSGLSAVNITFNYEKKGNGESPDAGDDLFVEYNNNLGDWVLLSQQLGSSPDMSSFQQVSMGVPGDGYHAAFRLRFRNTATTGALDDWFIDNVRVDYSPQVAGSPVSFNKTVAIGDSTTDNLIVRNTGLGGMTYSILNVANFSKSMDLFDRLMAAGHVHPGSYSDPYATVEPETKGTATRAIGPDVIYNAGGPDGFGYIWVDSDEPGGPAFNWVDIEATGTLISGLSDDNYVGPFSIGFGFPYYDSNYTQFWLGSNGLIGFGPSTDLGSLSNTTLPNTTTPNNIIALVWDDLNITSTTNTNGKALYQFIGGNLVVEYKNYPRFGAAAGGTINAEIILAPDGTILLQYQTIGSQFDVTQNTVGIENVTGTVGLQVSTNTAYLHNNLAVKITKPPQWLYFSKTSGNVAPNSADTIALEFNSALVDTGIYKSNIKIYSNDPDPSDNPLVVPAKMIVTEPYMCGDASSDNTVNISDAVWLVAFIFTGGPAPNPLERGNVNCDATVNISDAVYIIAYIFNGGTAPCAACK